jgi:hypothetical protein
VLDEQLLLASQILLENGFPIDGCSQESDETAGVGVMHTIHIEDGYALRKTRAHLCPLSFVDLILEEARSSSNKPPTINTLTRKPPNSMQSVIHHLLRRPIHDPEREKVYRELLGSMVYFILRGPPFKDKEETDEEFEKRAQQAVITVEKLDLRCTDQKHLDIVENIIRDIETLSASGC